MSSNKKVTLVGAGPGDPDLITLKGVKALSEAKVVLYDALVNRALLEHAPQAKKIFVGKRKDFHRFSQEEINDLLVECAFSYGNVVRLKGGDPFIFGRGSEELEHLASFGIETEVVSGISSAIAVPAGQGISLTQRGVSESFWVITGTRSDRELSDDIALAAQSKATVVILMGMHKLHKICDLFRKYGRADLPAAIIQNGTTAAEKVGVGTVANIEEVVEREQLQAPAVIVLGEVVRENSNLGAYYEHLNLKRLA